MSKNEKHFEVIVLGAGSIGSAACYHLAKRGISVLGIDQFDIPNNRSSHHGKSRMIRKAYYEHPDYVPLLHRAYELWSDLENESPEQIFFKTGALYLCHSKDSVVTGSLRSAKIHGLSHTHLNTAAIRSDFPEFTVPENFEGLFEPDGGFLRPELGIQEHARQAEKRGAHFLSNTKVLNWTSTPSCVEVKTNDTTYSAEHLIISAGPWAQPILESIGIELTVSRQVQAWFESRGDPVRFSYQNFPCWFIETHAPFGHYGFPILPGQKGLKIAEHRAGVPLSAATIDQGIQPPAEKELSELRSVLETHIQGASGQLIKSCTCLYTNTTDRHFVVGTHPTDDRISIAAGFSGHGYKFSTVIGEALADLVCWGKTKHPIDFLSPKRFI